MVRLEDVRAEIDAIRMSGDPPMRRVRSVLAVKRRIRKEVRSFSQGCAILRDDFENDAAERLGRSLKSMKDCLQIADAAAIEIYKREVKNSPLKFGPMESTQAYPHGWDAWMAGDGAAASTS